MRTTPLITALLLLTAAPVVFEANAADVQQLMLETRDGTKLETFIYLPDGEGPFPTLVTRTIYGLPIAPIGGEVFDPDLTPGEVDELLKDADELDPSEAMALGWPLVTDNGYALVVQNTRGRFGSEGVDRSWLDDRNDGYDLIEWVNNQSWSNGRIGLFGDSAVGMSAALAAAAQPPSLDALYLQAAPADPFGIDMAPADGGLKTETLLLQGTSLAFDVSSYHLANRAISGSDTPQIFARIGDYVQDLLAGLDDPMNSQAWTSVPLASQADVDAVMPFWALMRDPDLLARYRDALNVIGQIEVPTSVVSLWQDSFNESTMHLVADLEERGIPLEVLVLNGTHYEIDNPEIFPQPRLLSWFDRWLKDEGELDRPSVQLAIQGHNDDFVEADTYAETVTEEIGLFLDASGYLVTAPSEILEMPSVIVSDPNNPVPTLGGRNLIAVAGSTNHAQLLNRSDVLKYRSDPFDEAVLISGPIVGDLLVEGSAPSFDLSIRLIDFEPDGPANLIVSDFVRVQSAGNDRVQVPIDLGEIVHRVEQGHALVLTISGSDFPAWDRNPQTGQSIFEVGPLEPTSLSIVTGGAEGSSIQVPILFSAAN